MKRQRGRNRGGGGGGGGNKPTHNVNRAFDSNGPDNVKIRGHAQHVFEKYQQLARDSFGSGDRVLAENYLQHAEHYFRLLRTLQPQRPASEILGRDSLASGYDIDFEDESGEPIAGSEVPPADAGESQPEGGEQRPAYGEQRPDNRQDGRREERFEGQRGDRFEGRDRNDRPRDRDQNRDRGDRFEGRRDERNGENRQRFEGRRDEQRGDRFENRDRPRDQNRDRYGERDERRYGSEGARPDPLPVVEPQAASVTPDTAYETDTGSVLRGQDGTVSEAPAFLQAAAAPSAEEAPRPRRGRPRRPRSFEGAPEGGEGEAPSPAPEAAEG